MPRFVLPVPPALGIDNRIARYLHDLNRALQEALVQASDGEHLTDTMKGNIPSMAAGAEYWGYKYSPTRTRRYLQMQVTVEENGVAVGDLARFLMIKNLGTATSQSIYQIDLNSTGAPAILSGFADTPLNPGAEIITPDDNWSLYTLGTGSTSWKSVSCELTYVQKETQV